MTEFFSVILNDGLTSVFQNLINGNLEDKLVRRYDDRHFIENCLSSNPPTLLSSPNAATLPSLINNTQNRELQSALNKGYSEISQALEFMKTDIGVEIVPQDYAPRTFVNSYKNYFKNIRSASISFQDNDTETNDYNTMKEYQTYNKAKNVFYNMFDDGQFILPDGALVMINNEGYSMLYISIDVNGEGKGPNVWGRDLFTFEITSEGKLLPMGADGTSYTDMSIYCSKSSNDKLNGIACAAKALSDPAYFKKMY